MLNAKLVVVGGDAKKTEVRLNLPTIIGRGKEVGLTVPHALVSRQHAEIFEQDGRLMVRDMGSLNGTYINSTRIEGVQQLDPNQLLTLGNVTFRAVYEVAPAAFASNTPDGETVTFEEEKTLTADEVGASSKGRSSAGQGQGVSFDETVPVDLIVSAKSSSRPKPEPLSEPDGTSDGNSDILNDLDNKDTFASDTDKSIVDATTDESSITDSFFTVNTEDSDPASKSVSVNALEDLPAGRSSLSFAGGFSSAEESNPLSQVESVEIDLGDDEKPAGLVGDSGLGSFLKKLPK